MHFSLSSLWAEKMKLLSLREVARIYLCIRLTGCIRQTDLWTTRLKRQVHPGAQCPSVSVSGWWAGGLGAELAPLPKGGTVDCSVMCRRSHN